MLSSSAVVVAHADSSCAVLLGAQHKEPHSMHREHPVGTNGCSPGLGISFPQGKDVASGRLTGGHPSENQLIL